MTKEPCCQTRMPAASYLQSCRRICEPCHSTIRFQTPRTRGSRSGHLGIAASSCTPYHRRSFLTRCRPRCFQARCQSLYYRRSPSSGTLCSRRLASCNHPATRNPGQSNIHIRCRSYHSLQRGSSVHPTCTRTFRRWYPTSDSHCTESTSTGNTRRCTVLRSSCWWR